MNGYLEKRNQTLAAQSKGRIARDLSRGTGETPAYVGQKELKKIKKCS
jgi:hypothetical protein